MRIVPGEEIELEYGSVGYKFRVIRVTSCSEGYDVDVLMTDDFRSTFKAQEELARWSSRRFQKFFATSVRRAADKAAEGEVV